MGTTLKLYSVGRNSATNWELIPSKLLVVDFIDDYLATKTFVTINNFQYIKNELELAINVDVAQSYSQPLAATSYKYVSIQNENEPMHYYYVKKAVWRSKTCVRFELVMDVLNTFKENSDYSFKANTKINREHKDRFFTTNTELTINFDHYISLGESFNEGDIVDVEYKSGLDYILICTGSVLFYDLTEKIELLLADGYHMEEVIEDIEDNSSYIRITKHGGGSCAFAITSATYDSSVFRNIDRTPEDINPVLLCDNGTWENIEHNKSTLACDWYLLYRNQNDPSEAQAQSLVNPVDCYLIPSEEVKTAYAYVESGRITPSFISENNYFFFDIASGQTYTLSNGVVISKYAGPNAVMITKCGGKLNVTTFAVINGDLMVMNQYDDIDYISVSPVPAYYNFNSSLGGQIDAAFISGMIYPYTFNNSGTENKLDPITKLDRTDAKNIKLIKLPYCPYDFTIVSSTIQVSADWDYISLSQASGGPIKCLKLNDLNTKLKGKFEDDSNNPLSYLLIGKLAGLNPSINDLVDFSNLNKESKLYSSEFFSPTFYYDSFAFKFDLEKCDMFYYKNNTNKLNKVEINFIMTRTINSKFMFEFDNYEVLNNTANYSKYLPIARNNEEVLYNVPYINYIRTGYQYDVKNKNISNISNAIGVGLSAASIGVSLALPSAPLKVAGVVASIVSMAMSVKSAVVSALNNENSLKQKLAQAQNQTASVAGSDDVDLMSEYADNRLRYMEYNPRQDFEKLLFKLFFYAGYKSERMGIPTHNNRINFDYLECDASIEKISAIPNDCLEELINCFKNGVTYIHKTSRNPNAWDFEQKYENWETIFFQ